MTVDAYAERTASPLRFLHHLDPLSKVAATLPAMVVVLLSRDVVTPLVALAAAVVLLVVGARLGWRTLVALLVALPLAVALLSVTLGVWVDADRLPPSDVLWTALGRPFTVAQWLVGLATASRIAALVALSLVSGLTTSGPDLTRALVQHLRVPYRIGYTALAAFRFVPRFGHELDVIRAAHRVRGMAGGRGPLAVARRWMGYVVPLLVGALRHASRVALAMDARAFGATARRTERHRLRWRVRDTVVVVVGLALTAWLAVHAFA
ncbi:energy-coupling factor transporter transmembrane component T family protein [Agrococcus jejuensis]|uniref:Energy-coupling factor transport system permease protein n=1 Tax=Agrococcus jejuensis TaxID=399736 RepID=A0A1G8H001_9MICO|nr:energy-coupling factor transporter transmembrane component T [Agrococcus jejuensis]SDH99810.1 energy-coupling factor transport system permease protein [Agrococcus jejuensis]